MGGEGDSAVSQEVLALCLFVHILATVVWIGGILLLTCLVTPQFSGMLEGNVALRQVMLRLRSRFASISNLSLAALIVTGLLQMTADPHYDGLLRFENAWSRALLLKHALIIVMAALGLILQLGIAPALERASMQLAAGGGEAETWRRLRRREGRLTWLIAVVAVSILAVSAWLVSL